ncbi:MAG: hypothetical protein M3R13_09495 [Armatimonadota bacterium]|nr:hypothetical protein [Armatimonadota bacterium]
MEHPRHTTSQSAHVAYSVRDRSIERTGVARIAAAPDKDTVAIGRPTEIGLWLTTIRWNARTRRPNVDTIVPGGKGHSAPYLLCATISGGQPVYYYMQRRSGGDALVYRRRHRGSATPLGRSAFAGDAFDPATKVMVGSTADGIRIAKLGGSAKTVEQPPRGKRSDAPELFFHRGRLFAACDPVYELVGTEWKPFGNVFRILAKSSNGKYWLIGTEDKSIWKVTF